MITQIQPQSEVKLPKVAVLNPCFVTPQGSHEPFIGVAYQISCLLYVYIMIHKQNYSYEVAVELYYSWGHNIGMV